MKVLTWNCNGGFRNKVQALSSFDCDLYIIQECEDPSRVSRSTIEYKVFTQNHIWEGDNKNKGLGVFAKKSSVITKKSLNLAFGEHRLKWFISFSFENRIDFVATWAHRGDTGEFRYIGQFYKMLCNNLDDLKDKVFIGDFNSNKIWDYKRVDGDHSTCLKILESNGIYSLYHRINNEEQGREQQSTFLLQKKITKPYHIDYIFAPLEFIENTVHFEIMQFDSWIKYSDHVPIIWEI